MTTITRELLGHIAGGQAATSGPEPSMEELQAKHMARLAAACNEGRSRPLPGLTPEQSCLKNVSKLGVADSIKAFENRLAADQGR